MNDKRVYNFLDYQVLFYFPLPRSVRTHTHTEEIKSDSITMNVPDICGNQSTEQLDTRYSWWFAGGS